MFEAAELGQKVAKKEFEEELPRLRAELLEAHFELRKHRFPVIIIVSGADGAGKGELVHRLNEWLDPRGVETHAFWEKSDEERERPAYWRFWRAMPGRGRIAIFFGSWYSDPIIQRVYGTIPGSALARALSRVTALEKMLVDDGALIVKLWLHLPKKVEKKALKKLEKVGRITPTDWKHYGLYDKFTRVSEQAMLQTDSGAAPWHVIEATDRRYRELTVGRILRDALRSRLEAAKAAADGSRPPSPAAVATPADSILDHVDLSGELSPAKYHRALARQQVKLGKLVWAAHQKKRSMVMVFEGWDAAGKGSAIRRVTQAMDPRLYQVVGVAAPTDEELAHHYLWRFWRSLPRAGFTTIFDRSWYGRVLVERVEGFATNEQWSRSYQEINEFEAQLVEHGILLHKFWLHISPDEQLRRFEERQRIEYKQHKITDEDWRNRERWEPYKQAVDEMVARTSNGPAPWTLVAGNDKKFARVQIVKTIVKRLEAAL